MNTINQLKAELFEINRQIEKGQQMVNILAAERHKKIQQLEIEEEVNRRVNSIQKSNKEGGKE